MTRDVHNIRKIVVTYLCPECEQEHTVETRYVDMDEKDCPCCGTDVYVDAVCPATGEPLKVNLR